MYAIVRTGGKQYKVSKDDVIAVEKMAADPGQSVTLGDVLALGGDGAVTLGSPLVAGACVTAEVTGQTRADKIIVFKKKRRKNYRRKYGHRQCLTMLRIVDITTGGTAARQKAAGGSPEKIAQTVKTAKTEKTAKTGKTETPETSEKKASPKKPVKKSASPKKPAKQSASQSAQDSGDTSVAAKATQKTGPEKE